MASVIGMMGGKGCFSWGQVKEKGKKTASKEEVIVGFIFKRIMKLIMYVYDLSHVTIYILKRRLGDFLELNPKIKRLLMIGITDNDEIIEGESREQKRSRK
ncbi:hypothetical protein GQ457_15G012190 [Hibiscus cannabinus]